MFSGHRIIAFSDQCNIINLTPSDSPLSGGEFYIPLDKGDTGGYKATMNCIFCKIAQHELPATLIYEDEKVVAFDDLHPKAPIHKLIIPRKHIATLNDLEVSDTTLAGHLVYTAQHLAKQLGIAEKGYRLIMNCNADAGQVVFHIHLHLLGGRSLTWPPG